VLTGSGIFFVVRLRDARKSSEKVALASLVFSAGRIRQFSLIKTICTTEDTEGTELQL